MRTINKQHPPECLESYRGSTNWGEIATECKDDLAHQCYIEQHGLCIYCERELQSPNWQAVFHCEHLVPRSTLTRVFDYRNIALSCNGTPPERSPEFAAYGGHQNSSCGDAREDNYEPDLYLHPVDDDRIEQYFSWDLQTHRITAMADKEVRATYMIELLNLNNPYLMASRSKARGAFRKIVSNPDFQKQAVQKLEDRRFGFSSYLIATYLISDTMSSPQN